MSTTFDGAVMVPHAFQHNAKVVPLPILLTEAGIALIHARGLNQLRMQTGRDLRLGMDSRLVFWDRRIKRSRSFGIIRGFSTSGEEVIGASWLLAMAMHESYGFNVDIHWLPAPSPMLELG